MSPAPLVVAIALLHLSGAVGGLPQCGCNHADPFAGRQNVLNPGFNALYFAACPASSIPPNGTCTPAQLVPCQNVINPGNQAPVGNRFPPNWICEFNPAPSSDVAYYAISFATTDPYSWHVVESAPPVIYRPVPYSQTFVVQYAGGNGTTYCDSSADCDGAVCIPSPAPPRCGPPPSPSAAPSALPVPTPTPGPPASTCNLTGRWLQFCPNCTGAMRVGYRPEASIRIESSPDGRFNFSCSNDPQVGFCPLWAASLNGSGVLSPSGPNVTAMALNGSTLYTLEGALAETFSCATLNWLSGVPTGAGGGPQPVSFPVQWQKQPPSTPPALDVSVTAASFLGSGDSTGGRQFVATGVAILAAPATGPASVAVAGNGNPAYLDAPPVVLLLGAAPDDNGTIVVLSADVHLPRGSGATVKSAVKVGGRIDSLRANAAGDVAIAGSFGIALISGLSSGAPAVVWNDSLAILEPGDCGVCCWRNGSAAGGDNCDVDIGDDRVVVASFAVQDASYGFLWGAYSPSGHRFMSNSLNVAAVTTLFVDSGRARFGVGYHYVSNTGKESMIMPRVDTYTYSLSGDAVAVKPDFSLFDWDARVYRQPGQPCNGDVADGRVLDVRVGRGPGAPLLVSGRSDGGDSPFYCGMRNSSKVTPFTHIDDYTDSANMQSQAIVNMIVANGATGEGIAGQLQLTRLGLGGGGNTLRNVAAQTDASGNVYELQEAAYCIPNMGNLTVNGVKTIAPADSSALLVLNPQLNTRLHWAVFASSDAGSGDAGSAIDLDLRRSVVALALNTGQRMVVSGEIPGTGPASDASLVGYVVVLPVVSASNSQQ